MHSCLMILRSSGKNKRRGLEGSLAVDFPVIRYITLLHSIHGVLGRRFFREAVVSVDVGLVSGG